MKVRGLTTAVRSVAQDLWRTFFADPVRENAVRSHGGGSTGTSMVLLGVAAFVVAGIGVVLGPSIAGTPVGSDAVLGLSSLPNLPSTVPTYLYPLFVGLLLVTTFVGVFGSSLAPPSVAAVALAFITLTTTSLAGVAWSFDHSTWPARIGLPTAIATPLVVGLLRWRRPRLPVVQVVAAVVALLSVALPFYAMVTTATTKGLFGGTTLLAGSAESFIGLLAFVVAPAALLAGVGAVSFGLTVVSFLGRSAETVLARRRTLCLVALAAFIVWRAVVEVRGVAVGGHVVQDVVKVAVVLTVFAGAVLWWRWATRGFDETEDEVDDAAGKGAVALAILLIGSLLVPGALAVPAAVVGYITHDSTLVGWTSDAAEWAARVADTVYAVTAVGIVVCAALAARRRPGIVAAFVGITGLVLGLTRTWNSLIADYQWGTLSAQDFARSTLLVVLFAAVAADLDRRRGRPLTLERLTTAFAMVALTALVAQDSFLEDPFRPLIGFTGLGLVFFGVVWTFLTAGAHSSVSGLPGLGRTTVMIAYAVLTATIVAWGDATGGGGRFASLTDQFTQQGKDVLGSAFVIGLMAVWIPIVFGLAEPAVREETEDDDPANRQPDGPRTVTLPA